MENKALAISEANGWPIELRVWLKEKRAHSLEAQELGQPTVAMDWTIYGSEVVDGLVLISPVRLQTAFLARAYFASAIEC